MTAMRKVTSKLLIVTALSLGGLTACRESTNAALKFYIVSEQEIPGGRFIDTTNFPKLGYISAKPALVITSLADVYRTKQEVEYSILVDPEGNQTLETNRLEPSVTIQLAVQDGRQFTALTERAVGKTLLMTLDERPLIAPRVLIPLQAPYVRISHPDESELKKIENELRKLVQQAGQPDAAHEPPSAAAVRASDESMNTKQQSQAPADGAVGELIRWANKRR